MLVTRRIPLRTSKGPAKSTPVVENGLAGRTLALGKVAVIGFSNLGLDRIQVTQRDVVE